MHLAIDEVMEGAWKDMIMRQGLPIFALAGVLWITCTSECEGDLA